MSRNRSWPVALPLIIRMGTPVPILIIDPFRSGRKASYESTILDDLILKNRLHFFRQQPAKNRVRRYSTF